MDMKIYCLKCKIKTDTEDLTKTRTKNNRNLIRVQTVFKLFKLWE